MGEEHVDKSDKTTEETRDALVDNPQVKMPSYAKFMKDILSNKRKPEDNETETLNEECSAALYDLGVSINLMPLSLFRELGLGKLKPTPVTLQLVDSSIKYPRKIIENILVKVDKFIFLVDFVILDMEEDKDVPLILGRPFLATGRALIYV
ncbi:uncharacterized protein LOC111398167 [Olea europaea var. sylvestris]|uniref:uncharacterized protein LOC111398167 n=1 Tax=Olea europaea var. sylvestris TaxID=158386 RepID=UPI000C1D7E18|nr:uncharacterized protein LOC111398167 [Olea europaea var. sylvestris]